MEKENKEFQSLSQIVSGLSKKIEDLERSRVNFFETKPMKEVELPKTGKKKKINQLESEFYAPNSLEEVFTEDILLEQKIIKLEKEIIYLDKKIKAERTIGNPDLVTSLAIEKNQLMKELNAYRKEYKKISPFTKLKNRFLYCLKFLMKLFKKINIFSVFETNIIETNTPNWKKNLQKLNDINAEIDEIIKTNTPYGENEDRYEKLSKSLNQALKLRNSINKNI